MLKFRPSTVKSSEEPMVDTQTLGGLMNNIGAIVKECLITNCRPPEFLVAGGPKHALIELASSTGRYDLSFPESTNAWKDVELVVNLFEDEPCVTSLTVKLQ
ncbi:hypothetical protein N7478_006949 [Penicillium angulare]|uniref:uncharacterized protein n=1 Tax=Penicillium angulare TaxID=116970 RepID=UPI002541C56C|nr:uncharacterized protein N7478_006949 [Penicillium angulare]KAJ5281577.1 hypothetical protein N7478_006949 [Penicillium angulare]